MKQKIKTGILIYHPILGAQYVPITTVVEYIDNRVVPIEEPQKIDMVPLKKVIQSNLGVNYNVATKKKVEQQTESRKPKVSKQPKREPKKRVSKRFIPKNLNGIFTTHKSKN